MLLAFACVDRHHFVWQTCLLEKERDFQRVRRRVVVKADHLGAPFVICERTNGFRRRMGLPSTLSACRAAPSSTARFGKPRARTGSPTTAVSRRRPTSAG